MLVKIEQVCRDYLALRGESPDLLPHLEEGEEGAVLTLSRELEVKIKPAAVAAALEVAAHLQHDTVKMTRDIWSAKDYLKPHSYCRETRKFRYIPIPRFDGENLEISEAAYYRMLEKIKDDS